MCEICHMDKCPSGCPNADEPIPVKTCGWCENGIYEGDEYYRLDGEDVCTDCMDSCKTTAERDDD